MPNQSEITVLLCTIIREQLDLPPFEREIEPGTLLFADGLELDSFGTVELISRVEAAFGFEFREEDFREEHFLTIGSLGVLVDRYVNA